jgi:hypothetical protein
MFGYNDEASNDVPFNGTGRLRYPIDLPGLGQQDDFYLVNYTYFQDALSDPSQQFLRDPERPGWRTGLDQPRAPFVGGFNAPYTYPDLNNLFLAAVNARGEVLQPSFYRDWPPDGSTAVGNPYPNWFGPLAEDNPNWLNDKGKYLLLRPRPVEQITQAQVAAHDQAVPLARRLGWPLRLTSDLQQELRDLISALQASGQLFPYPEDATGDVKNLIGGSGGNDSIWIDLDFPVMTAPDGRKFKPLFAVLVTDLDNRVNVNVHGNVRAWGPDPSTGATVPTHASNQGWGAWEVNPAKVLNKDAREYTNLLMGGVPSVQGRYGRDNHPHSPLPPGAVPLPRQFAPVDFDAVFGTVRSAVRSGQLQLPVMPFQCFPPPPLGYTYGGDSLAERIDHPNLYNPFQPALPDRGFALSNMEALLRFGDTGSPALTSDLIRLCPNNLADASDPESVRRRGLLTVCSFDPDRPGISPWFWWRTTQDYNHTGEKESFPLAFPSGPVLPFPTPPTSADPPPRSEFGNDWRASRSLTALRRLDLNRYLPPYPNIDPATGMIPPTDYERFLVAQRARQYMAAEIFEVLFKVTGANPDISPPAYPDDSFKTHWHAAQRLAQLAVNIVDYIDDDDYMTPFNWYPLPWTQPGGTPSPYWVFGTELPRVLINEAYAEEGFDHGQSVVDTWVELYNPMSTDTSVPYRGAVRLDGPNQPYMLLVTGKNSRMRNPANVLGNPDGRVYGTVASFRTDDQSISGPSYIRPADGIYENPNDRGNKGYYFLGPGELSGVGLIPPHVTLRAEGLGNLRGLDNDRPSLVLRRLACAAMPYSADPSSPLYNPYVTTDYMEDIPKNHEALPQEVDPTRASLGRNQPYAAKQLSRQITESFAGTAQPKNTFFKANDDLSGGRSPFDWLVHLDRKLISPIELLHVSSVKPHELTQEFMTGNGPGQRFKHRAPWLDEDVEYPLAESHRLYRALEFLGTGNQTVGMMTATTVAAPTPSPSARLVSPIAPGSICEIVTNMRGTTASGGTWQIEPNRSLIIDKGLPSEEVVRVRSVSQSAFTAEFLLRHVGQITITPTTISERVPGKININTMWDEETFLALCDPYENEQPRSNNFNVRDVKDIFAQIMGAVDGGVVTRPGLRTFGNRPGPRDEPFRSLATGLAPVNEEPRYMQYPNNGIEGTILRKSNPSSADRRLFELDVGTDHPYMRMELLNKIFNNVTVRSNVFAVWVTAGYFEVIDDSTRPVKLGAELGRAENRQVRHRMFAIVDRSVLTRNPGPQPRFDPRDPAPWLRTGGDPWATGAVVPYFSVIE